MAIKKESLNNFLPDGFETLNQEGYKENFSADKISTGYEKDVPELVSGPNLNNLIDVIGKNTNTLNSYVEYLNSLSVNKTPIVDSNNQLNSTQIGLKVYSATETYLLNDLVTTIQDGKVHFYRSLVANNTGHDLTDEQYWEEVKLGGGSGVEVCDIGMSLYVDEKKWLRRYLNGQIVDRNKNTEAFFTRLQKITTLHPSLLCTEDEWQTAKTMSAFGQVGKFVFNYSGGEIVSVRLPRVVNVQGLFDLQNLGMTVAESLPNIAGTVGNIAFVNQVMNFTGCFYQKTYHGYTGAGTQYQNQTSGIVEVGTKASLSSSTYQDNAPVQPEAIQYPYFIQIATGSETENNIVNDIELNNPYSLFDSKYSDHELNNLSWLKSEGQWNAKAVYPTAYDELLREYNNPDRLATFNRDAFEVVGSLTITEDGIASGFSSRSYISLPNNVTLGTDFEIYLSFVCLINSNYTQICRGLNGNRFAFQIIQQTGTIKFNFRDANIELGNKTLVSEIQIGKRYIAKIKLKNGVLSWGYYLDNIYTGVGSVSTLLDMDTIDSFKIGGGVNGSFTGSIDLKQFSITVDGVKVFSGAKSKVKLSTEEYTDYDFVLNTADETFRLPLKTKLASGNAIVGNGMTLGLTNGTQTGGLAGYSNGSTNANIAYEDTYGVTVGNTTTGTSITGSLGVTTDPTKSGIETSDSGLYLYYYVGETVQNANLIDAGRIGEQVANCITRNDCKAYVTETYQNGTSWYRIYSDGWCEQGGFKTVVSGSNIISFLKNFVTNDPKRISVRWGRAANATTTNVIDIFSRGCTNSQVDFYSSASTDITWQASGYIK